MPAAETRGKMVLKFLYGPYKRERERERLINSAGVLWWMDGWMDGWQVKGVDRE